MKYLDAVLSVAMSFISSEKAPQQSFWQAYFVTEKEQRLYLSSLVTDLPQDVLNVILHFYMDVTSDD